MKDLYQRLSQLEEEGRRGVLITLTGVTGSSPRHLGSKMLVMPDGSIHGTIGGGKLEAQSIAIAVKAMENERYEQGPFKETFQLIEEEEMLCGGQAELLFEPVGDSAQLVIFGAGHIGHALAPMAKQAGFRVTVVDNRVEFANRDRFPLADEILAGEYEEMMQGVVFSGNTYVVIVTHGHKHDETVLEYCIQQPHKYIGMIGSVNKTRTILRHLREKGIDSTFLEHVYSPVGLNIGAETPFEIAVSILSEIIAVRSGVETQALSMALRES